MGWAIPIFFLAFMAPCFVHGAVHITEVAWMGTASSQYSEWIELYNDDVSAVNLAGWKLYEGDGGALVFTFTKSIPGNGYLLLERTTASAPDAVPGVDDEEGSFGGGGLANTGEDLVLKDAGGSLVEELDYLDGWPAGDAPSKKTMQWNGTKWITATATPKASAEGEGDDEGGNTDEEEDEEEEDEEGAGVDPIPKVSPNAPHVEFTIPRTIYRGVPYEYAAQPVLEYNYRISTGTMYWNFGDGTSFTQHELIPVTHVYEYAGVYTLSFRYSDPRGDNLLLKGTKKVTVVSPSIAIQIVDGRALELKNTTGTEVDLSNWKVSTPGRSLILPELTILAAKATTVIPFVALGISTTNNIALFDPSGSVVASTTKEIAISRPPVSGQVVYEEELVIEPEGLVAHAGGIETPLDRPMRNRTKTIIVGAVALFAIGLVVLLERLMGRREYQEE